jgi:hypothetical protein
VVSNEPFNIDRERCILSNISDVAAIPVGYSATPGTTRTTITAGHCFGAFQPVLITQTV